MKNIQKTILFFTLLLVTFTVYPILSNATITTIGNEDELVNTIKSAQNGDTINLNTNIYLSKPIEMTDKTITINGNGFTISRNTETWSESGDNATLITAGAGATLTLTNISLTNSQKYGVQAYNGGHVILDGVTISNCGYGGVLVNAGTVEVKNLNLGYNGDKSNNGIEIAKGKTTSGDFTPTLIMNGTLTTDQTENVVYVAENDKVTGFELVNTDSSVNKIYFNDNKVVVTDQNNNIIFQSNEVTGINVEAENYVPNVTITINVMDKLITMQVIKGSNITKEDIISYIDLTALGFNNYSIEDIYSDVEYTAKFNFDNPIDYDTTVFVKLTENLVKDSTPKTGNNNTLELVFFVGIVTLISTIIYFKKEEI